ncbi:MAG: DUF84 family protein [Candidatus Saccharibacteria bacterium]
MANRKTFVLCSSNVAKQSAANVVLQKLYGDAFELRCIDAESGVSETPDSDDEGIRGALGRIADARQKSPDADAYIGLEGIITANSYGTFLCGWAVIELRNGARHMGCSAKVQLPEELLSDLSSFKKLSEITAHVYPERAADLPHLGTNGVITNGLYTRVDEFVDAMRCAFGGMAEPNSLHTDTVGCVSDDE